MRKITALATGLCLSLTSQAQHLEVDSMLTHRDTLEAYIDNNRQMHIYHESDVPVDVFELARYYGVTTRDILDAKKFMTPVSNPEFKAYLIPVGEKRILSADCRSRDCVPLVYTVRPKETIFRIARRYFDMKVDDLRTLNGLENDDLAVGQRLIIGWFIPQTSQSAPEVMDSTAMADLPKDPFYPEIPKFGVGLAYWNKAQSDYTHMFALHDSARPQSVMEITNPMLGTRVVVKVIGGIPPSFTEDIELVVSPAVAMRLGILDPKFRAEYRFVE